MRMYNKSSEYLIFKIGGMVVTHFGSILKYFGFELGSKLLLDRDFLIFQQTEIV